jgi:hypothetical protein
MENLSHARNVVINTNLIPSRGLAWLTFIPRVCFTVGGCVSEHTRLSRQAALWVFVWEQSRNATIAIPWYLTTCPTRRGLTESLMIGPGSIDSTDLLSTVTWLTRDSVQNESQALAGPRRLPMGSLHFGYQTIWSVVGEMTRGTAVGKKSIY